MGKLIGNPWGEVRGKVGGLVFSRNKQGPIIRAYTMGVQPGSPAQIEQRIRFGTYPTLYKTITMEYKRLWNNYATSGYQPRRTKNTGQMTGQNAYNAVNLLMAQNNASMRTLTLYKDNVLVNPAALNQVAFTSPVVVPPERQILPYIVSQIVPTQKLVDTGLKILAVTSNFGCTFEMRNPSGLPWTSPTLPLRFGNSDYLSMMLMLSQGVDDETTKQTNMQMFTIASTGKFFWNLALPLATTYKFVFPDRTDMADYYKAPTVGQYCIATLFAIGEGGSYTQIVNQQIQIT